MIKFSTFLILLSATFCINLNATTHAISSTADLSYSPSVVEATVGDTVVFTISSNHPTAEVSQSTWDSDQATPLTGGFGTMTSSFSIILTALDAPVLYYVCVNHVGAGMKGLINVSTVGIGELINEANFEFGPNPLKDRQLNYQMSIDNFSQATMNIYSIDGKLVQSIVITEQQGLLPLELKAGKYFIQLIDDKKAILVVDRLIVM